MLQSEQSQSQATSRLGSVQNFTRTRLQWHVAVNSSFADGEGASVMVEDTDVRSGSTADQESGLSRMVSFLDARIRTRRRMFDESSCHINRTQPRTLSQPISHSSLIFVGLGCGDEHSRAIQSRARDGGLSKSELLQPLLPNSTSCTYIRENGGSPGKNMESPSWRAGSKG